MLRDLNRKTDQTLVKVYGHGQNKKIKVIRMGSLQTAGLDRPHTSAPIRSADRKSDSNICRAKQRIFELAFCNKWDYFFTGTLDPEKYDRTDLQKYHSDLTLWIRNQMRKYEGQKIDFLLIPELHSDKRSWHIHGFLRGVPADFLKQFQVGDRMGKQIADRVLKGVPVYNWIGYANKFGFCSLEPIRNDEAVAKYVTKYITKELFQSVREVGAHMYYCSRGLNRAETVGTGYMPFPFDLAGDVFEGAYATIGWIPYSDEVIQDLMDRIEMNDPTRYNPRSISWTDLCDRDWNAGRVDLL